MAELRSLAHGINPPLLELRGLPDALAAVAWRAANTVRVDSAPIGRFDRTVEAAVYFCCIEAIQNADKHAPGADGRHRRSTSTTPGGCVSRSATTAPASTATPPRSARGW